MEVLWNQGDSSIRNIQHRFPEKNRPTHTTIQTTVYRLETKEVVKRTKKIRNFHVLAASFSRDCTQSK